MATNIEKKTITIKQGNGSDALEMKVQVTQEELDKMEQIRHYSPEQWEGKELDLLQEARKLIKEEANIMQQTTVKEVAQPNFDSKEEQKKGNPGLWWTIGILAAIFIIMKIITGTLEKRNREAFQQIFQNNPGLVNEVLGETITHEGLTLKYPRNWSFSTNDLSDVMFMIGGTDENDSEFGVIWTTNKELSLENYIDNVITGYDASPNFDDFEYSAIYDTKVNGMDAIAVDYSYNYQGKPSYAQIIGFENDKYSVFLNLIAHSKSALEKDFNVMKNSIRFTDK